MSNVRLLVVSDLHAQDVFSVALSPTAPQMRPGKRSWLDYSLDPRPEPDPIVSLIELVRLNSLRADYIVVPGDLCDQANGAALRKVWDEIEVVREAVGARATIATSGNHDLDSRFREHPYDPRDQLLKLEPEFPILDATARAEFWGYGIADARFDSIRFVIVNSCAHHGGAPLELEHGRISEYAQTRLKNLLSRSPNADLNVLVCHHHPHPIAGGVFGVDDRMLEGETVLQALDESECNWLVIHGHRHVAQLTYANGSASNSPVVLAAASASACLDPRLAASATNQVHLLTVETPSSCSDLRGIVETWDFRPAVGWTSAGSGGGLPGLCGFGYRGSTQVLAEAVKDYVERNGGPVSWQALTAALPDLRFLTPRDRRAFMKRAGDLGIEFFAGSNGMLEAAQR